MKVGSLISSAAANVKAASVPALAAQPAARMLDTSKIPFQIHMEVTRVDAARLNRAIAPLGWSANQQQDCSHGYNDSDNVYIMIHSPANLTMSPKTWEDIGKVCQAAREQGAQIGNTAALNLCVNNSQLDLATHKNMWRMQRACEAIIYKMARNGNSFHHGEIGWGSPVQSPRLQGGYYFCLPPSAHPNPNEVENITDVNYLQGATRGNDQYGGSHQGFQPLSFRQHGYSQFRYFTGTTDADAVRADVEMVLGMVKAAHEGRWPDDIPAHPITDAKPVSWRAWDTFMTQVMGDSPQSATKLEQMFRGAGGQIEPMPLDTREFRDRKARLEHDGWRFEPADLKEIGRARQGRVRTPGGGEVNLTVQQCAQFLCAQCGETEGLPPEVQTHLQLAQALRGAGSGVRLVEASSGAELPAGLAAVICGQEGRVRAVLGEDTVVIGGARPALSLAVVVAVEQKNYSALPVEARPLLEQAGYLHEQGFELRDGGQPLRWSARALSAFVGGTLTAARDQQSTNLNSAQAVEGLVFARKRAQLSQADGVLLERAERLVDRGYAFVRAEVTLQKGTCAFLDALTSATPPPDLAVRGPGRQHAVSVSHNGLRNLTALEEGSREKVDESLRVGLDRSDALRAMGCLVQVSSALVEATPAELVASLEAGGVTVTDPAGTRTTVAPGVATFIQTADKLLAITQCVTPQQRADMDTMQQLLTQNRLVGSAEPGAPGQPERPIQQAQQLPWLMGNQVNLHLSAPGHGQPRVEVRGWDQLHQVLLAETRPQEAGGPHAQLQLLRNRGVQFYFVGPTSKQQVPLLLNTALAQRVSGEGAKARLPEWTWWKGFPRRKITIRNRHDLEKLARKLA